jgi:hypothetical protein
MPDKFGSERDSVLAPSRRCLAVTPSDSTDYLQTGDLPRRLWIGGAGNLVVQMVDDAGTTTFIGVPAGAMLDIRPRRILATGTTCTAIVAFN